MIDTLTRLFRHTDDVAGHQQQREALLDLLVWTMYADDFLALPENDEIERLAEEMAWESITPVPQYLNAATARIRHVRAGQEDAGDLLDDIYQRLGDDETRTRAYDACRRLARADGKISEGELQFLDVLEDKLLMD